MNIWEVTYTTIFSSSSGMESYSNPPETRKSFVLTKGDSLDDVRAAIQSAMDNQTTATLETAKWLGQSLNAVETIRAQAVAVGKLSSQEFNETILRLKDLCKEMSVPADWPENLYLPDIIEKYILRGLQNQEKRS